MERYMSAINFDSALDAAGKTLREKVVDLKDGADQQGGEAFGNILKGLVDEVDSLQKNANSSIKDLVAGNRNDIHNVAIKMEEASVAFDLMMEIRNKLVEAYQEVSRMQA